ncbi:putative BOI-related E3 ubiquitin-protein ligase 3 [Panicum miliaceum]|uniref:BOI-related E3 ubiquitin-protein ligase 3 n=1 Tax=Panicum miliaceum TaxID=4540 RepID=A0A3L6TIK5_PANMI|nr:putative BOI-related E3 ubiquitin-protein ligase 3 [Panicum miliaceum]
MAVEAHHLLHAGGQRQLLAPHAGWAWAGDGACCEAPASAARQGQRRPAGQQQQQQLRFQQHPCAATPAAAAGSQLVAPPGRYAPGPQLRAADASESGVTFGGGAAARQEATEAVVPRKRKRAGEGQAAPALGFAAADVAAHFQQQLVDVDRLVLQHTSKMWAELREQRRRHAGQVVAAVEAAAAKRLRAKDEEIERIGRLNWALEERVRSLYVEAQVWRDLAQSNEAAANALRGELQQALDAQQARCGGVLADGAGDADSCCCGENDVAGGTGAGNEWEGEDEAGTTSGRRTCAVCGEGAAEVLLLPCRHLCACAPCAGAARACPVCGCAKNGSVCVNFS